MNKKNAVRLLGSAATLVAAGAVFLTVSGMAHGLEAPALAVAVPAQQWETPMLVAQADPSAASSESAPSAPAPAPEEKPVSFTNAQADRGEPLFEKHCAECHGEDLKGGLIGGPPLRGLAFEGKYMYEGAQAGVLFDFMSTAMPPDSPGRYSPSQYADMMAYILKRNGFQAGGAELPSDSDALYALIMVK
jgi:mono/diheme cytochrome c family protein